MRDFLWGYSKGEGTHIYLKDWKSICAPKQVGGLHMRQCKYANKAFMTKLICQLTTNQENPWLRLTRSKYLIGKI
jgi:hypothetical protein